MWSVFQVYTFFSHNRHATAPALLSASWTPATACEGLIWLPVPPCAGSSGNLFSRYVLSASCVLGTDVGTGAATQARVLPSGAYILERGADSELNKERNMCVW